ncbi:ABC transporter substrate-binding protein [Bacillus sp. ISL-40]|uniref:ABC transporter substrate-binding protein n=1 Tax=unclassified Bacillus (in: firmicutes) TaxID=185979 RepID=UPI001BEBEFDE|nr:MULTISPECIES: ABC transporter substrate-binding protein [unclassified Bacillus (in: firmicutes)]MBT2700949.1 ABC transporter substrate-binding protein [Bacillus sp. ISL-40]MBT2742953.1 ABC transporter substrate-binding protein [Bacillus sp. ISL-77]
MKCFKAFTRFLLIVMSAVLVLAGCSSKESSSSKKDDTNSKGQPYELNLAYLNFTKIDDLPLVQEEINKIARKKINATVKLVPISGAAWSQQTNLMLTGNEKLDLIVSSSFFGYNTQAAKGQYVPLDDLLKSNGQGILKVVPERLLEGNKVNGKIYGIPSMRDWGSYYGYIMRKDIVDKYKIDLSQVNTFADLESVFKIVKEKEPTLTPVVNTQITSVASVLAGGKFDILGDSLGAISFKDKKMVNMFEEPEYVEAVKLARKWFKAGYIMKDSATSQEAAANIVKANKGFGYFSHMKPGFDVQEKGITGHEMVSVKLTDVYSYTDAATGFNMSIARNSQNPEKAMEFINLLYTDKEIMNLLDNGIEGKHYAVKSDGVITLPEGVKESKYVFGQWQIGNNFLTYPWEGNPANYWEVMKKHNDSAIFSPAFGFTFNPDPVKTEIAASTNVLNQYKLGIESGTLDPEKSLKEFNKKLKASGIAKIIAEKQKQYDKWKEKK